MSYAPEDYDNDADDNRTDCAHVKAMLNKHLQRYARDRAADERRSRELTIALENNSRAISELTEATKGLVESWRAVSVLQRFLTWATQFAVIGTAAAWLYSAIYAGK